MSWRRNEPTAVARRCDLRVYLSDGVTPAPRDVDFVGLGLAFVCGPSSPHYALALGTMTNKRRPLVVSVDTVDAVDTGADTLAVTGHAYQDIDGPFTLSSTGTLPGGVAAATEYWLIVQDANTVQLAASLQDAIDESPIDLTSAGSGTISITPSATCQRGLDGEFTYEATQAETDHGAPMTTVLVEDPTGTFSRAFTHVEMSDQGSGLLDSVLGDGITVRQGMLANARQVLAPRTKSGRTETTRDIQDGKNAYSGTVTGSGRDVTIHDLD